MENMTLIQSLRVRTVRVPLAVPHRTASGTVAELLERSGERDFEAAFVGLAYRPIPTSVAVNTP